MQRRMLLGAFAAGWLPWRLAARTDDEERIKALLARLAGAVQAKDFPRVIECYLPDESSLVFDVQGQFAGSAAVRNHWDEVLKSIQGPMHFEMSDVAITTGGTVAYAHCMERVITVKKGEGAVDKTVRNTRGLRKVNGKWFIVHEHASVSVNLATGKPDFPANASLPREECQLHGRSRAKGDQLVRQSKIWPTFKPAGGSGL